MAGIPDLKPIIQTQTERVDAALERFNRKVDRLAAGVRKDLHARFGGLSMSEGVISNTAGNLEILGGAGRFAARSATQRGYGEVVNGYLRNYQSQVVTLEEVFSTLGVRFRWQSSDRALAKRLIGRDRENLMGVVDEMAAGISRRARMAVGAAEFGEVMEAVEGALAKVRGNAGTLAETGINTFYRTLSGRKNEGAGIERYVYMGPDDKLTRPFCRRILDRTFTRAKIDRMDNGQLANVFISGGGWNCRHQWYGVTEEEE